MAIALVSLLRGVGYDAYVCSGYAVKSITQKDESRIEYPINLLTFEETFNEKKEEKVENKYRIKPPKQLKSQYDIQMEERAQNKIKEAEKARLQEEERIRKVA